MGTVFAGCRQINYAQIATNKQRVKPSVQKVLNWDLIMVIMAYGSIVENDAKSKFKEWFLGKSI